MSTLTQKQSDRISRVYDKVVNDELKNNPRYENNIYVYSLTHPLCPRLYTYDELKLFSDDKLYRYYLGEDVCGNSSPQLKTKGFS